MSFLCVVSLLCLVTSAAVPSALCHFCLVSLVFGLSSGIVPLLGVISLTCFVSLLRVGSLLFISSVP